MDKYKIKEFEREFDILGELGVPNEDIDFLRYQKHKQDIAREKWN